MTSNDARQRLDVAMSISNSNFKTFILTEPLQWCKNDDDPALTDLGWAVLSYVFEMAVLRDLNSKHPDKEQQHLTPFRFAEDVKESTGGDDESRAWTDDSVRMTVALALIQITDLQITADEILERSVQMPDFDDEDHFRRWCLERYLPREALARAELKVFLDEMMGDEALFRYLECDGYPSWSVFFNRWRASYTD